MIPTPRTDEKMLELRNLENTHAQMEWTAFAKGLEREINEAHAVLDNDPSQIIRNAEQGYPEGREPHELTLAERVQALCKYAADWKRWAEGKECEP
jgi:hypothetical protein